MRKISVIADTGALISLELGNLLPKCFSVENFKFIVGEKVKLELEEIATIDDEIGNASKDILCSVGKEIIVKRSDKEFEKGEYEALELLKTLNADLLISDDIEFVRKNKSDDDRINFSTIVIFILYNKEEITKEEALRAIDKIFEKREWGENLIYIKGRQMIEENK